MKSRTTESFRDRYRALPENVRKKAREAYRLFRRNPRHPSLMFKQVDAANDMYSVRVGIGYRAVGTLIGPEIIWFWIGSHAGYDKKT